MRETFGSTCHGAGRARSRNNSRNKLDYQEVLDALKTKGIAIRVASPKLVMEEAPESYKASQAAHAASIDGHMLCLLTNTLATLLHVLSVPCACLCASSSQWSLSVSSATSMLMLFVCMQDVTEVVNTCHEAGISKLAVKLRPIAVIKG